MYFAYALIVLQRFKLKLINQLKLIKKKKKKKNLFSAQKPNTKMNKHVNKVRKATDRAEAITAGRQQNKQQYLINSLLYIQDLKLNYKQERREREHLHAYFSRSNV